jgi:hypothetical protein
MPVCCFGTREAKSAMRQALKLHPDSLCSAATHIEMDIARPRPGSLVLSYLVTGKIGELRLPPATPAARADELWRHTCFEAFVRASPGTAYYEFNFAPSTQWAVYHFGSYRSGMRVATEIAAPRIEVQSRAACWTLQATLALDALPATLRLGLAAVIEEANGRKSYWALAHPQGKPDFHHSDCFACRFPQA